MKLSISTIQILDAMWANFILIVSDSEYLIRTITEMERRDLNFTKEEKEIAKQEIAELVKTL